MLRRASSRWLRPAFRVGLPLLALAVLCLAFVVPSQSMPAEVPPQITVTTNPSSQPFGSPSVIVTIDWCDDDLIIANTRQITLNGVDVTSTFSFGSGGSNCSTVVKRRSVGTVTLNVGLNMLNASICDGMDECNSVNYSLNYDPLDVTPKGQAVSKTALMLHSQTFQVVNRAPSGQYALAAICTGAVTDCQVSPAVISGGGQPLITYRTGGLGSTGTVKLRATSTTNGAITEDGWVNVTASTMPFDVSFAFNNNDNQQAGLCADSCFTARYAQSTIPYISLGTPRSVALRYDGDRVAVRPFVYADVSLPAGAPNPVYLVLQATVNGGSVTFLNGEQQLRFRGDAGVLTSGSGQAVRLAGQFNASSHGTGMHPLVVTVHAVYADSTTDSRTFSSKLMVVKEHSPGLLPVQGWTVGGIQRLYTAADGTILIVEGDGSGVYFSCTSYTTPCNGPSGDFTKLRSDGSGGALTYTRLYPDSTKVIFNNLGQMKRIADRLGKAIDVSYNQNGRIERIYDEYMTYNGGAARTSIDFWYGASDFTIASPGPNGTAAESRRAMVVSYDANNRVSGIRDPDGVSTLFTYDAAGRLETITDRRGSVTRYVYDATSWKVVRVDLPQIQIDAGGGTTTPATPSLSYVPWQHVGVPTGSTASPFATPPRADTIFARITDAELHAMRMTVDRWGQPTLVKDTLGNTVRITRSGIFATVISDALGRVDSLSYIGHHLTRIRTYKQPEVTFTRNAFSQVLTVRSPGRPDLDFGYDAKGRLVTRTIAGTYITIHRSDSLGRDTAIVDPAGHTTRFHYSPTFGSVDSVQFAAGQWTFIRLDGYGRDSSVRSSGRPAAMTRLYDVFNRDSLIYDGVNAQPMKFLYDNLYLVRVTDPKGQVYRSETNPLGWVTRVYDPSDTVTWSRYDQVNYDRDGLIKSVRNRRAQWVDMRYDVLHRLTWRRDPALAAADSFEYSPNGRLIVGINNVSRDSIRLGDNGADTVVTVINGNTFKRTHSERGNTLIDTTTITTSVSGLSFRTRMYYWNGSRGWLDSIRIGSDLVRLGYDGEAQRSTVTWPNGLQATISRTWTHDLFKTVFSATSVDSLLRRTYSYDSLARIVSEERPVKAATKSEVRAYAYDGLGQLRRYEWSETATECTPKDGYGCEPSPGQRYQLFGYEYDPASNLMRQVDSVNGNAVTSTSYVTPNRLTAWKNLTYDYDLDGNRTFRLDNGTGIQTNYGWSATGRLISVQVGGTTDEYDYNAFGEIVRRRRNGVAERYFVWDEDQLLAELNGTASAKIGEYAYYPGIDRPLALITGSSGSTIRYYHQDARNSAFAITNGNSLVKHDIYSPWGEAELSFNLLGDTSRLGWKGLVWDNAAKLYYARARWYDPESRRFMSEDPIGLAGGLNLYVMADNDPVNRSDPTGLDAEPGMCQYTTVGGVLDSWDFSGCGGGGPSMSYIAVMLMAMEEPGYPSLDVPAMGPHGGGGGGAAGGRRPICGGGFPVNLCPTLNSAVNHLYKSDIPQCNVLGQDVTNARRSNRLLWNPNLKGAAAGNDGTTVSLGPEAFIPRPGWTHAQLVAAVAGSMSHEFAHIRYPGMNNRDHSFGQGDTPHDFIYRIGISCAGFDYL